MGCTNRRNNLFKLCFSRQFGLLLYEGRRLTATEAQETGLVDDVLWPASFREDLMPRVQTFTAQSSEVTIHFFLRILYDCVLGFTHTSKSWARIK